MKTSVELRSAEPVGDGGGMFRILNRRQRRERRTRKFSVASVASCGEGRRGTILGTLQLLPHSGRGIPCRGVSNQAVEATATRPRLSSGMTGGSPDSCSRRASPQRSERFMKSLVLPLLSLVGVVLIASCKSPDAERSGPNASARFSSKVRCECVQNGSTNSCRTLLRESGKLICPSAGVGCEVTWKFVCRRGEKDVYAFEQVRHDAASTIARRPSVEYGGDREVVFHDDLQIISIIP